MTLTGCNSRYVNPKACVSGAIGCLFLSGFGLSPSQAGEWSNNTHVSSKIEFDDNYQLLPDSNGGVLLWTNEVYTDFIYKTHDSQFDLIGDLIRKDYWGEGSNGLSNDFFPRLEAKYFKGGKRTDFNLGAAYAIEFLPPNDLETGTIDTPATSGNSTKTSLNANAAVTHRIDLSDSIRLAAALSDATYTGEGTDNVSADTSLIWTRKMTRRTEGKLNFGFNYVGLNDAPNTDRYLYTAKTEIESRLTKRLTVNAGIGVNLVDSRKTDLNPGGARSSQMRTGYIFEAGLDYHLKTLSLSLDGNYGTQASALGDLEEQVSLNATVTKSINDLSSASVSITASRTRTFDGAKNEEIRGLTISPTYSRQLARNWDLLAGYKFSLKDSQAGTATSNNIFISLTRNFASAP